MKLIVCMDNQSGMAFNNRRQSKDREVRRDMLSYVRPHKLWMNTYSRQQFGSGKEYPQICVNDHFPAVAGPDDYCFLESPNYLINEYAVTEIVIYNWNRLYPADVFFQFNFEGWVLDSVKEFVGFSHDNIKREVWKKV